MTSAKSSYEEQLVFNFAYSNSNKIFDYIHSLTNHSVIPPSVHFNDQYATSNTEKACLFNEYFHSIFTHSSFVLPPVSELPSPESSLINISFSDADVYSALASLDETKSMGIDRIPPKVLKHCAIALYTPIFHLFSLSLQQGYLPAECQITPIPKSGDKMCVTNYRPISLLCTISKVLEHIVYDKVIEFLSVRISTSQFGFTKNSSTLQQLLIFLSDIYNSYELGLQTDVIYTDFKKAFDTVPHDELLFKLWSIGICGSLWKWFRAYLTSRFHCVSINNSLSSLSPVLSGVPQGSILGPILFLVYINDLPLEVTFSKLFLFADDGKCTLPLHVFSDSLKLQQDIDVLNKWCNTWNMHFNYEKFTLLSFFSRFNSTYTINDSPIVSKTSHKDLGVVITSDLKWNAHLEFILSKAYKVLHLLRRTFNTTNSITTKKFLYLCLIRSRFSYCSPIWRPFLLKNIKLLEDLQRRAYQIYFTGFHF